jgi:hypothetical protein
MYFLRSEKKMLRGIALSKESLSHGFDGQTVVDAAAPFVVAATDEHHVCMTLEANR